MDTDESNVYLNPEKIGHFSRLFSGRCYKETENEGNSMVEGQERNEVVVSETLLFDLIDGG